MKNKPLKRALIIRTFLSNVKIKKSITLVNGGLDMVNKKVLMNNPLDAQLIGESETRRVFGSTGYMERVKSLTAPNAENLSNMGAILTSTSTLGNTTVRRSSVVSVLPIGNSVQRLFRIKKSGASTVLLKLRFSYLDTELNGNNENTMILWRKISTGPWVAIGASARDVTANWVEFDPLSFTSTQESYFTLGPPGVAPLAQTGDVLTEEITSDENAVTTERTDELAEIGVGEWSVFPNPATERVQFSIESPLAGGANLLWHDEMGRLVKMEEVQLDTGTNLLSSNLSGLAAGTYIVSCAGLELKPLRVLKVSF